MNTLLRLLDVDAVGDRPDADTGWLEWLTAHVDPVWRPDEWDPACWLFTGDLGSDRTAAWACRTPDCPTTAHRLDGRCDSCRRALAASGLAEEMFDHEPRSWPVRPIARGVCSVTGCRGDLLSNSLCFRHERSWRDGGSGLVEFMTSARPFERLESCLVGGCGRERVNRRGLCWHHGNRLRRERELVTLSETELAGWVATQQPRLGAHQFSLVGLAGLVRVELLFALQCRDTAPPPLNPGQVRILASRLVGVESIRDADPEAVCESGGVQYNSAIRGLFRDLRRHLERAWVAHTGTDPYAGDVWDVGLLDLQPNGSRRWPATQGIIDFGVIELVWLREVLKAWARDSRPYLQRLREALRGCRVASQTLVACGRSDPTSLGMGDFAMVVRTISEQHRDDGSLYSAAHRNLLLFSFCQVIEHGRANGLMGQIPDPFRPAMRGHRVVDDINEDEVGKALPESVIRQLDANIGLLGPRGRAGSIRTADLQAMHQTIYQILRDTGRRPGEVVSLKVGCVEITDGQHNLVYDNHKAGRKRRRLPITVGTAEMIIAWEHRRVEMPTPPATRQWLFPSPLLRSAQSAGHLTSNCIGRAFHAWMGTIAVIDSELLGPDGTPSPFDRGLITPYVFRHCYAQRHADAGVPVDVLKELLDHAAIQTTMGYYTVSLKRKQHAIRSVGSLAVDAGGNPAPFSDVLAYERASVSVPFGNCTEPSNVKAGGGHCPIRFQCAGCGFYRPDPSYLPTLEQHIASLRADRETARAINVASYVLANMNAEIDAFTNAADQMRRRLSELDPDEQAEVEESARILRRARAARIPIITQTG